jgi:hypothetical protein
MLENLSEQTTVEKGAKRLVDATKALRAKIKAEEATVTKTQNEIAKLKVDALNVGRPQRRVSARRPSRLRAELEEKTRADRKVRDGDRSAERRDRQEGVRGGAAQPRAGGEDVRRRRGRELGADGGDD